MGFRGAIEGAVERWAEKGLYGSSAARRSLRLLAREALSLGLFDPDWYRLVYPDIAKAAMDPLSHYLAVGRRESRDPSITFNRSIYESICPDFIPARQNPVLHYLLYGRLDESVRKAVRELHTPPKDLDRIIASGWFDADWYAREYPSIPRQDRYPIAHYMSIGWRFARKPYPGYDPELFGKRFPGFAPQTDNPLRHLLSMREIPHRLEHELPRAAQDPGSPKVRESERMESKDDASISENQHHGPQRINPNDWQIVMIRAAARSKYIPEGFRGKVHLFSNQLLHDRNPTMGWRDGIHGTIQTVRMNGDHNSYLMEDLEENAGKVDAVIRRILNEGNPPG
jgi:hypothetical protein